MLLLAIDGRSDQQARKRLKFFNRASHHAYTSTHARLSLYDTLNIASFMPKLKKS